MTQEQPDVTKQIDDALALTNLLNERTIGKPMADVATKIFRDLMVAVTINARINNCDPGELMLAVANLVLAVDKASDLAVGTDKSRN